MDIITLIYAIIGIGICGSIGIIKLIEDLTINSEREKNENK